MRLVIKRKRWARGGKNGDSRLLNSKRNMCCLGFYLNACGIAQKHLKDKPTPARVSDFSETPGWLLDERRYSNSSTCMALMTANDSSKLRAREREAKIKKIFAKHGVQVVFE